MDNVRKTITDHLARRDLEDTYWHRLALVAFDPPGGGTPRTVAELLRFTEIRRIPEMYPGATVTARIQAGIDALSAAGGGHRRWMAAHLRGDADDPSAGRRHPPRLGRLPRAPRLPGRGNRQDGKHDYRVRRGRLRQGHESAEHRPRSATASRRCAASPRRTFRRTGSRASASATAWPMAGSSRAATNCSEATSRSWRQAAGTAASRRCRGAAASSAMPRIPTSRTASSSISPSVCTRPARTTNSRGCTPGRPTTPPTRRC